MTPLAGFAIALIAGWTTRDAWRAAAVFVVPFLAVTAAQTWGIAAGDGVSPPDTVWPIGGAISYYIVQALIMAVALGLALLLGVVRSRGIEAPGDVAGRSRRTRMALLIAGVATAAYLTIALLALAPHSHSANGSPPVQGLIGIAVLIISLIAAGVLAIIGRRAASKTSGLASAGGPALSKVQ